MLSTQAVANTFIFLGFKEHIEISPMKLQKLVYILYKEYLKDTNEKLFQEEFSKWKYGPVIPSLYYEFSSFGASPITKFAKDAEGNAEMINMKVESSLCQILIKVWEKYRSYTGTELSAFTHRAGTAWSLAEITLKDEDIKNEPEFN